MALKLKMNVFYDKISKYIGQIGNIEIYIELVNIANVVPIKNIGIESVILTNRIISLYMLQMLSHKEASKFYKDVLQANADDGEIDFEICTADKTLVFDADNGTGELVFSCFAELVQSFYIASDKKKMLVGRFEGENNKVVFFSDNTDEDNLVTIRPSDKLILLKYEN